MCRQKRNHSKYYKLEIQNIILECFTAFSNYCIENKETETFIDLLYKNEELVYTYLNIYHTYLNGPNKETVALLIYFIGTSVSPSYQNQLIIYKYF